MFNVDEDEDEDEADVVVRAAETVFLSYGCVMMSVFLFVCAVLECGGIVETFTPETTGTCSFLSLNLEFGYDIGPDECHGFERWRSCDEQNKNSQMLK